MENYCQKSSIKEESYKLSNCPKLVNDEHLGTVVGKYINATTLKNMHLEKEVIKLESYLEDSMILSNLMDDFPPISKEDPVDVRVS